MMDELNPETAFRGLPLSADQAREIEHYIRMRVRTGAEWDTPELRAMIADILNPPEVVRDDETALEPYMASERSTAQSEESSEVDQLRSEREYHGRGP
jgi:hypothetical protein